MAQSSGGTDFGGPPPTPRWVKLLGIVILVLALLFVGLHLTGNSPFGPGSHTPPVQHELQQP